MILSAPHHRDPDLRHDSARIRLLLERNAAWTDLGEILPERLSPGSREWSGSAVLEPRTGKVTLFFTAAGHQGTAERRFEQRLFQVRADLDLSGSVPALTGWRDLTESLVADGVNYVHTGAAPWRPGMIKGFRDPGHFRDPADGRDYLLFTGSACGADYAYDGVIGLGKARNGDLCDWELLEPLIQAQGLCNEMERPHIVCKDGLYYLFWSSQKSVFAPDGPTGPTGLYGMVADHLLGPYRPLNGSGLVIANPHAAPTQAYCWWVTPDLDVISFIDRWATPTGWSGRHFGGTLAPRLHLSLNGDRTALVG